MHIAPAATRRDIQREIVRALHRDADVYARGIEVGVTGNKVRLTGTVGSWREREAAERAAAHATGVTVDNRLSVASTVVAADGGDPFC
jgi:osmotically-inducible protein OsmY